MKKQEVIQGHWNDQAEKFGDSIEVSWGDNYMIDLEIGVIGEHIRSGDTILDIGCANGYAAFKQFELCKQIKMTGIDFSEKMIELANKKKNELGLNDEINFQVGDIRNIECADNTFDVVYTTRVLINLSDWEEQQNAIEECVRVTKRGGKIIFSEAFLEPMENLNTIRSIENLPPLTEPFFNRYLKKNQLESFLKEKGLGYTVNSFSSIYYLGSRFLRELATTPSDHPGYTNPVNKDFYDLEKKYSGGSFGIQQAYIAVK